MSLLRMFHRSDRLASYTRGPTPENLYALLQIIADYFVVEVVLLEATTADFAGTYRAIHRWGFNPLQQRRPYSQVSTQL